MEKYYPINKAYLSFLILIAIYSLPVYLFANENDYKFEHVQMGNGLSQNVINCIFQDSQGFKWFGTQDGLFKYDGYNFKIYKSIPYDSTSLTDNWVQTVAEDKKGNLWIGTYSSGIFKFNRKKEKFTNFRNIPGNRNSLINNRVWIIHIDKKGNIWIGTSGGLDRFDILNNKFIHYKHSRNNPFSINNDAVNAIYSDNMGSLWLGTWGGGLNKLDIKKNIFQHFNFEKKGSKNKSENYVKSILNDDEYLWLGTKNALVQFDLRNFTSRDIELEKGKNSFPEENSILSLLKDSEGHLWIGTHDNGLYVMDLKSGKIENFKYDHDNVQGIRDNWISSLYEDNQKIIWIGTGKGIEKVLPYSKFTEHIGGDKYRSFGLSFNEINSIFEDHEGKIWIGTWNNGLNCLDFDHNIFKSYKHSINDPKSLLNNIVWGVYEDKENTFWIGTYAGINVFNNKNGKFESPPFDNHFLSNANISSIIEDNQKNIWIGTWGGGLYRYNKLLHKIFVYRNKNSDLHTLSDDLVTCLYIDSHNNLWIGTNAGGLNLFHPKTDNFTRFQYIPKKINSLSNNNITSVFEDSRSDLWVGTWGGGINYFDPRTNSFKHYTEEDGLSNNIVYGILEDNSHYLWLSTDLGLSRFDSKNKTFVNYDSKDGLGNDQFGLGHLKNRSGKMIFGGINGLTILYPDSIKINNHKPNVVLTGLKIFNNGGKFYPGISKTKEVILNYYEHDFTIEFAALDYSRPDKIQYYYFLEGYDKDWNSIGNTRKAYYTNMSPGEYLFKVKAMNRDNIWSQNPAVLRIKIIPPFWKTWPFFMLISLLIVSIIYILYRNRIEQLLKLERMRNNIAIDLHDDIGASLTRISLFSDAAARYLNKIDHDKTNEEEFYTVDKIKSLLAEIGENSRALIGSMSDIVWTVNPQNDAFENITIRMKDYTAKILEVNEIDYEISIDPGLTSLTLPMDFRRNLFLIYKESISNIVRHARASQVNVKVSKENNHLVLIVKDNGRGFDSGENSRGNGLKNIQKRAAMFNGNLLVSSEPGNGTVLKALLKLP